MSSFESHGFTSSNDIPEESNIWDAIVVGLGGHGSSTLAHIASKNQKVLGIERFPLAHSEGSSHGRSRIIRTAYFEDPRYVPLLQRSLELWRDLQRVTDEHFLLESRNGDKEMAEQGRAMDSSASTSSSKREESGKRQNPMEILRMTGGIMIGRPESNVVKGTLESARLHGLKHEILSAESIRERFPSTFDPSDEEIGVLEEDAGFLVPENCVTAYVELAERLGAQTRFGEAMLSWEADFGDRVHNHNTNKSRGEGGSVAEIISVKTSQSVYRTRKLILTVGAWAPEIYGDFLPPERKLHVERRVLYWFQPKDIKPFLDTPIYIWELANGDNFYGFPCEAPRNDSSIEEADLAGGWGVKIAKHCQAEEGKNDCTPETINREVSEEEVSSMREVIEGHIPSLSGPLIRTATCMYTMTLDEHFLIDFHPSNCNVVIASPCSGHGFKFCSVIGEILSDLVTKGSTVHDISLFRLDRAD